MDISGEYPITAPRAAVWAALNDPDIVEKRHRRLRRTGPRRRRALSRPLWLRSGR